MAWRARLRPKDSKLWTRQIFNITCFSMLIDITVRVISFRGFWHPLLLMYILAYSFSSISLMVSMRAYPVEVNNLEGL